MHDKQILKDTLAALFPYGTKPVLELMLLSGGRCIYDHSGRSGPLYCIR